MPSWKDMLATAVIAVILINLNEKGSLEAFGGKKKAEVPKTTT